jgi:hypothetical protein
MFEPTALQVRIELLLDVRGQGLALLGEVRDERGVVLLHQPVEPGVLGAVARVGESTGGFPAVGMHRLRVLAQACGGSVWTHRLRPCNDFACRASGSGSRPLRSFLTRSTETQTPPCPAPHRSASAA